MTTIEGKLQRVDHDGEFWNSGTVHRKPSVEELKAIFGEDKVNEKGTVRLNVSWAVPLKLYGSKGV